MRIFVRHNYNEKNGGWRDIRNEFDTMEEAKEWMETLYKKVEVTNVELVLEEEEDDFHMGL